MTHRPTATAASLVRGTHPEGSRTLLVARRSADALKKQELNEREGTYLGVALLKETIPCARNML